MVNDFRSTLIEAASTSKGTDYDDNASSSASSQEIIIKEGTFVESVDDASNYDSLDCQN